MNPAAEVDSTLDTPESSKALGEALRHQQEQSKAGSEEGTIDSPEPSKEPGKSENILDKALDLATQTKDTETNDDAPTPAGIQADSKGNNDDSEGHLEEAKKLRAQGQTTPSPKQV